MLHFVCGRIFVCDWKVPVFVGGSMQADFEDSLAPTWDNLMRGQINLRDAVNRTISFEDKARNKLYKLNPKTATLLVRPRGWHLQEAHIEIDGEPATGALVDFGLYFFHNHVNFRSKYASCHNSQNPWIEISFKTIHLSCKANTGLQFFNFAHHGNMFFPLARIKAHWLLEDWRVLILVDWILVESEVLKIFSCICTCACVLWQAWGIWPFLLSSKDAALKGGGSVEYSVWSSRGCYWSTSWQHPRNCADWNTACRVPDAWDSVWVARAFSRLELWSMGLHLQFHQDCSCTSWQAASWSCAGRLLPFSSASNPKCKALKILWQRTAEEARVDCWEMVLKIQKLWWRSGDGYIVQIPDLDFVRSLEQENRGCISCFVWVVPVQVGMKQHFLKSYTELLIQTCHRRGVHAMGGMVCNLSSPLCLDKMLNVDTKHNKWFHIQDQFCGYQM